MHELLFSIIDKTILTKEHSFLIEKTKTINYFVNIFKNYDQNKKFKCIFIVLITIYF